MSHDHAEMTTPAIVVRVQDQPAADPQSVLVRAVEVVAPAVAAVAEGAAVSLAEVGDAFAVAVAGPSMPRPGEYVVAERSGASWSIAPRGRGA